MTLKSRLKKLEAAAHEKAEADRPRMLFRGTDGRLYKFTLGVGYTQVPEEWATEEVLVLRWVDLSYTQSVRLAPPPAPASGPRPHDRAVPGAKKAPAGATANEPHP